MRKKTYARPLKDMLLAVKLETELEKLALLRGVRNADGSHVETFLHYEDLPRPPLEDEERIALRIDSQMERLYQNYKRRMEAKLKGEPDTSADSGFLDVNPMTHNPYTGEPYDYSEIEAKYGPYRRAGKEPITVTLRPSAKDVP